MELMQHVEHGLLDSGKFVVTDERSYLVSESNRKRITDREKSRSSKVGEWLQFPTHPAVEDLQDHMTRIRWEKL